MTAPRVPGSSTGRLQTIGCRARPFKTIFRAAAVQAKCPVPQHLFRKGFLDRMLRHSSQFFGVKEGSVDRP